MSRGWREGINAREDARDPRPRGGYLIRKFTTGNGLQIITYNNVIEYNLIYVFLIKSPAVKFLLVFYRIKNNTILIFLFILV